MKKITLITITAFTLFISSCHRESTNVCPGTPMATWKVDGESQKCITYVYTHAGTASNFSLSNCGGDETKLLQFIFIPYPPVVGSTPLAWDGNLSNWNGLSGGGQYILDDTNRRYYTDSTTHTGSFDIASVNTTDKTITGTFHFNALQVGGAGTVHVTDGVFTSMKYE